jgi:hypothetical protein
MLHDELFRNTGDEEVHELEDNGVLFILNLVKQNFRLRRKVEIFGSNFGYAASLES